MWAPYVLREATLCSRGYRSFYGLTGNTSQRKARINR